MRVRVLVLIVLCAALSGCATFGQMEDGLKALVGERESTAFQVLGYPDGKQQFGSDTVYVWSTSSSGAFVMPQTAVSTGSVGGVPTYSTTMYNQVMPYSFSCTIKIITSDNGVIKSWDYRGNLGGCEPYIFKLNDFAKSKNQNQSLH